MENDLEYEESEEKQDEDRVCGRVAAGHALLELKQGERYVMHGGHLTWIHTEDCPVYSIRVPAG